MARKKKMSQLPVAGNAFAFPLDDGRFSVCRVLLDTSSQQSRQQWRGQAILVAGSAWIGEQVPTADDPALRPILHRNHHAWNNEPNVLWVSDEPPPDFTAIGNIDPTAEEQAMPCMTVGNWDALTVQPLAQWRWDNDRAATLAEDVAREKQRAESWRQAQREREEHLRRITLNELRHRPFFRGWKGISPAKIIRASQKVMSDTIEKLIEIGPGASEQARMAVLQHCIESFNHLDAESGFIATLERDDICEEFEAVVHACGLGAYPDLADRWRQW